MKDKRQGKLDKHFPILLNGRKVKILSYRIETQNGHEHLTLKTMLQNPWLRPGLVGQTCCISIGIGVKERLQNLRCYCYGASGRFSYYFYILKEGDTISYGEVIPFKPDCKTAGETLLGVECEEIVSGGAGRLKKPPEATPYLHSPL